jgi:selenocysteine lyase/cysteine desulfurase
MHCPDGFALRPPNTGWFAEIGALGQKRPDHVPYAEDGFRFWGATFDPSGLYRMLYVFDMLEEERIGIRDIHNHVAYLQSYAIERLDALDHPDIKQDTLLVPNASQRGHFLTFQTQNAGDLKSQLEKINIITDYRDDRLRFGFGLYQNKAMIDALYNRLKEAL